VVDRLSGEISVRLLPFGPHPVAVEKLNPRLFQSLFDRGTGDAEGISAPAFKPPNGLHR
jgi:hypothetical protein